VRSRFIRLLTGLGSLLLAATLSAQQPGTRPQIVSPPPSYAGVAILVRNPLGGPFSGMAVVRLYNPATSYNMTATTQGGEAFFDRIALCNGVVEVRAPGYQEISEPIEVLSAMPRVPFFFTILPERDKSAVTALPSSAPVLAPKARKELDEALKALQDGDLKKAEKRLAKVRKLAPNHPDVSYLEGMLSMRRNQLPEAQAHFERAVALYPRHVAALSALGEVFLRQGKIPQAISNLEQALANDPDTWQARGLLAAAYLHQNELEKARVHAERAVQLTKGKQPAFRLLLAQILARLNRKDAAEEQVKLLLKDYPNGPDAADARRLLEQLKTPAPRAQPAPIEKPSVAPVTVSVNPVEKGGVLSLPRTASDWKPREVDAIEPAVASDVTCSLPDVLEGAGKQVQALVSNLERITATEQISYEELNDHGDRTYSEDLTMNYVIAFQRVRPNVISVDEFRMPIKSGESNRRVTPKGQAALAMIFHPLYSPDFEMTCEGLGQLRGRPVWVVDFHQRADRPPRFSNFRTSQGVFRLKWKGRAWITANSYQIAQMEIDLMEPIPEIRLERDHELVQYSPVQFAKTKSELWLPSYFEIYQHFRGRWYHMRHTMADFMLFSVETTDKVADPTQP